MIEAHPAHLIAGASRRDESATAAPGLAEWLCLAATPRTRDSMLGGARSRFLRMASTAGAECVEGAWRGVRHVGSWHF